MSNLEKAMTELEQAARQALDALIGVVKAHGYEGGIPVKAIISLRQALEQKQEQPKQEPVAWMYDWEAEGETVTNWLTTDYDEAHSPTMGCTNIRPLYAEPPKREWVGLTPNERWDLWNNSDQNNSFTFANAVEAKLKEKNA